MSHDDVGMSKYESACIIVTSVMMSYGMIGKQRVMEYESRRSHWGWHV